MGPTGCSWNSKLVTTPKLPLPPRRAQNRSSFSDALAVSTSPLLVTTSAESRLSIAEAVLPHEPAKAAAESEAADACSRDHAARGGEAVDLRLAVEDAPGGAALNTSRPRLRVDVDAVHEREVDHERLVRNGSTGGAVAAAFYRDGQAVLAGEVDRGDHVGVAGGADDDRRPPVDHAVPDLPGGIVAGVAIDKDEATDLRLE